MLSDGLLHRTTLCIGCKACEVACKQWNQLPATNGGMTTLSGNSYDNTGALDGLNWRHVKFVEQFNADRSQARWLLIATCVSTACARQPGRVSDGSHHPHRVRHRGHPVRCVQWLPVLHRRVPIRRHRHQ